MGHDPALYPLKRILSAAETASSYETTATPQIVPLLADPDSAVRYWGAMGILIRGQDAVATTQAQLIELLSDDAPSVQIVAAQALGQYGSQQDIKQALHVLIDYANIEKHGVYLSMLALNAVDAMDQRALPVKDAIAQLPRQAPTTTPRMRGYVPNLIEKILADLDEPEKSHTSS